MILDREELERRLSSPKNLVNFLDRSCAPSHSPGAKARASVVVRAVAGALAIQSSVPDVAENLGLTENVVRGAVHSKNPEIRDRITGATERVRELALDRLLESLGLLTVEKVSSAGAKDISAIAANMSKVVDHVTPKQIGGNVQLILYAPKGQQREEDYEIVEV